jgi:C-terminal AAA-associated domain
MIDAFGFVLRQSSYYRQAAEILGLIVSEGNYRYKLTPKGEQFLRLPAEKRASFICKLLLEFPVMNNIFIDISTDQNRIVTKHEIILLLKKKLLTGSTLERRARTIMSWFRWIRNNLGLVEVDGAGNIRIDRQSRLA